MRPVWFGSRFSNYQKGFFMKRVLFAVLGVAVASAAFAQSDDPLFSEGDWSAYKGSSNLSLLTANKEETTGFGMVCGISSEKCSWSVIGAAGLCKVGEKVPVLVAGTGGVGGIASEMGCSVSDEDGTVFELRDFDAITGLVSASDHIQLATPTDAGIVTVEYPTKGYLRATVKLQRLHPPKK